MSDDDFDAIVAVSMAQDTAWWGVPDGDAEDVRSTLDRVSEWQGSLAAGVRLAIDDRTGDVVGVAMLFGHGETNFVVDPESGVAGAALGLLVDWLIAKGATKFEFPSRDEAHRAALQDRGIVPTRSSFELDRSAVVDDLDATVWPAGITTAPYRPRVDDQEVHDLIYSVWTDVAGHTYRAIDEWRSLFVEGTWFDPALVILTRDPDGRLAGVTICRTFTGGVGWVSQIAVGRPDRGIGLGRAMLVEALHRLAAIPGITTLALSVEAANGNALGLYRSVGLEVSREWVHCSPP